MKKTRLWIGVLMLIGGSHIAYAGYQETGDTAHEKKCESMSQGDFSISGLDANKDGVITKEEYLAGNPRNTEKIFNHLDANGDGMLDLEEQKQIEAIYKAIHQQYKAKTKSM